jgi:hypothetical protein
MANGSSIEDQQLVIDSMLEGLHPAVTRMGYYDTKYFFKNLKLYCS